MSANDNGPAFPTANDGSPDDGMTLRDYFAAKAMAGAVSQYVHDDGRPGTWESQLAEDSYTLADAMLKARQP